MGVGAWGGLNNNLSAANIIIHGSTANRSYAQEASRRRNIQEEDTMPKAFSKREIEVDIRPGLTRLLEVYFKPVNWEYRKLSHEEKEAISEKEFEQIKRIYHF